MLKRLSKTCVLSLAISASLATAQTTGSIEGIVSDPSQLAIPGASLTARQQQTGVETRTAATGAGYYLFENLPEGVYDLSVSHQGFQDVFGQGNQAGYRLAGAPRT